MSFGKHLRQYINRSKKEEKLQIEILKAGDIKNKHFAECKLLYEKMFSDKGIPQIFNAKLAHCYDSNEALLIGMVYYDAVPVGFDAVIYGEKSARLWLAAFDFRDDATNSQVLSRAHQQLDWEIMCWCKEYGIEEFDFGGISNFENPNGIDNFKLSFERNNKVTYQNYLVGNSLLGKIAIKIFMMRKNRG